MIIKKAHKAIISADGCILKELLTKKDKAKYSVALAKLAPNKSSKPHKLKSSEAYFIIKGTGIMHIGKESRRVTQNQLIYIQPNSLQYIKNIGKTDLIFLCIVSPPWKKSDEVVFRGKSV
ncbi:MAG: cupin domain-containing protein [Candidatus Woesearchaeota archaeon]